MTGVEFYCPVCETTHDDPRECPEADGDEDNDLTTAEIRDGVVDELENAHAAFVVYVVFPREDNDEDEMRTGSGRFIDGEELSKAELVAATARLEERIEEVNDELNGDGDGLPGKAVGVPASALFGGDGELPDTDSGGIYQ